MTRDIDALRALRDAVKAGTDLNWSLSGSEVARQAFPDRDIWGKVLETHLGSLDAAHALHKAVLPGWGYSIDNVQRAKPFVYIVDDSGPEFAAEADTPARAWLLVILEALIAQQGAGTGE